MSLKNKKVKYTVSPGSLKGYHEVYINYSHKGKDYKQLTYVKDNPKFKEKDYIRQAKKQFKPNFKVQAQPKAYFHFPVIPVVASLVVAGGLGTGGYFTYKYFAESNAPVTETCMVNFDSDGGSYVASKSVAKGKAFDAPENPVKKVDDFSYHFEGWFLNDTIFDFAIGTTVDITLKAHWSGTPPVPPGSCIVNFDSDGGSYVASKIVTIGKPFDKPTPDPTKKEGDFSYGFGGWYLGDYAFKFGEDTVNDTTTLKARWNGTPPGPTESYIVTFTGADCSATRGGNTFTSDLVEKDTSLTLVISPKDPAHFKLDDTITVLLNGEAPSTDYYTYVLDGDNPNNYVLNIPKVTGKTEILASTTEYCILTYDLPYSLHKEPEVIKKGSEVGEYLDPLVVENYSFIGWYYDKEHQVEYVPSSKIFEDTTIYGLVLKGDVKMPLTFVCQSDGASIKLVGDRKNKEGMSMLTERNLKYNIIYKGGTESNWKPIKAADTDGNFSISAEEGTFSFDILPEGVTLNKGDRIQFKGDNYDIFSVSSDTVDIRLAFDTGSNEYKFDVQGNIMSLLCSDESFYTFNTIGGASCFVQLFSPSSIAGFSYDSCNIVDASNLVLPATVLSQSCYKKMFENCTSLVSAPDLPANYALPHCYENMFAGCKKLIYAPKVLPASILQPYCYQYMFYGCESLQIAPELPATTLAYSCYVDMFNACKKLEYLKVGFGTPKSDSWPGFGVDPSYYTYQWLGDMIIAGSEVEQPQFYWKGTDDTSKITWDRDVHHVPDNWIINTCTD